MGRYLTTAALMERFGPGEMVLLTDRAGSGVPDDALIERALADAEARVDAVYSGAMPAPVPLLVQQVVADIARYGLAGDRAYDSEGRAQPVAVRYREALNILDGLAAGRIRLDPPAVPAAPGERVAAVLPATPGIRLPSGYAL